MHRFNSWRTATFLFLILIEAPAVAASGDEFQLIVENDVWSHTDRYYTNGIKFGVGRQLNALREPAEGLLRRLTPEENDRVEFGLFAGQNLYTPKNIKIAAPQPFDRPWAAWLYLGGVAQVAREKSRLDTVEIDLGVVGPAAGGRWVQSGWHNLIGAPQPQGWDNQLPNEPAFLVSYLQKRRYGSDNFDIVPHAGITVGTVMTLGRAGATLRLGQNIGGFGVDTIEPGGVILQNTHSSEEHWKNRSEWFVFLGVDHRLVAHNIFLDGTVFHDSASVDRRTHVYDLSMGLSARFGAVRVSVTRVRRSEEFYTPAGGGGAQFFHSINLGFEL
ncbi:MAG: lipid A deacylase LpxR family protein [Sulfuricellaceae bacterium]|nr:lipid A deacylase LpxR family protein [Sulfuricellaceae bacterium]